MRRSYLVAFLKISKTARVKKYWQLYNAALSYFLKITEFFQKPNNGHIDFFFSYYMNHNLFAINWDDKKCSINCSFAISYIQSAGGAEWKMEK